MSNPTYKSSGQVQAFLPRFPVNPDLEFDEPNVINADLGVVAKILSAEFLAPDGFSKLRLIQNTGTTSIYYTIDSLNPTNLVYHGVVYAGQQVDFSGHTKAVYAICPDAPLIVATVIAR